LVIFLPSYSHLWGYESLFFAFYAGFSYKSDKSNL
jgi:hypothetical protein